MSGTFENARISSVSYVEFGSGQVVTKIVADISTRRRNVDVAAVSNAQFFYPYGKSYALT